MTKELVFSGGINTDDSEYFMDEGDHVNAKNINLINIASGKNFSLGLIASSYVNDASAAILAGIPGTFKTVASIEDTATQKVYYINYNSEGNHLIICYDYTKDITGQNAVSVIFDARNLFTDDGIIYRKMALTGNIITGIAFIDNFLIFTDGDIYKLNVTRPIVASSFALINKWSPNLLYENITLIKRPPIFPPQFQRITTNSLGLPYVGNNISHNSYQFAYRYIYVDGEVSVIGMYSPLCRTSYLTGIDEPNVVLINIPLSESIPVDILQIDLICKEGNAGSFFIIKSWNIHNADDLSAMKDHNNFSAALTFYFYGNLNGQGMDISYVARYFDLVPLHASCLETIKNMVFVAGITEGINAPSDSSLSAATTKAQANRTNATGAWYVFQFQRDNSGHPVHTQYLLFVGDIADPGYYYIDAYSGGTMPPYPTSVQLAGQNNYGNSADEIAASIVKYTGGNIYWKVLTLIIDGPVVAITDQFINDFSGSVVFKSLSQYKIGIIFYDNYLRNTGVITSDDLAVSIPFSPFDNTGINSIFIKSIDWSLSNANALLEIPLEACYYSIAVTKNQSVSYFISDEIHLISYYKGDGIGTPYTFNYATFQPSPFYTGTAIDISNLNNNKKGYTFNKGDKVQVYISGNYPVTLNINGQYGSWILCDLYNFGLLTNTNPDVDLFIIYTPYQNSQNEPFYEVGNIYSISNPGQSTRNYSVSSGSVYGDITILKDTNSTGGTCFVESMNADESVYQNWDTDIGRINAIVPQPGQIRRNYSGRFSENYISGTLINGINSFDALNEFDLPTEIGYLEKIIQTSKLQMIGSVMIAIGQYGCASVYIGENQIMDQENNAFTSSTPSVIGSINQLVGAKGTLNPESVVKGINSVFWYSMESGLIMEYNTNGIRPVSLYKINSFIKNRSESLLISNAVNAVQIIAVYDFRHDYYVINFPAVSPINNTPLNDVLFDDGNSKTLCYDKNKNRWITAVDFYPEYFGNSLNDLLLFKNGIINVIGRKSTTTTPPPISFNNFLGVNYTSFITKIVNEGVTIPKFFGSIKIKSTLPVSYVQLATKIPFQDGSIIIQLTDLLQTEIIWKDGIWYGVFMKNMLTPGQPSEDQSLNTGEDMQGNWAYLYLEIDPTKIPVASGNMFVNSLSIDYIPLKGLILK